MPRRLIAAIISAAIATTAGCADDHKTATAGPNGKVRLSAAREPFTFSSWDVGRVEWTAPPADAAALPPHAAVVLTNRTVLPLRELTLAKARTTPGLTVGKPEKVDDGHGGVYANATPVDGSGFHFDFADDRLVHFVAAPYDNAGSPAQPVFEALDVSRTDAYGDVKQYPMPLGHDECVDLFGGAAGLETELKVPPVLN